MCANPRFDSLRIAQQIAAGFDIAIDKDTVPRILARHYRPESGGGGPSWLSFLGHSKDSLWSIDLFRCESILLRSHWDLVVMDVCTRRLVGFGVQAGDLDGVAVCHMFNRAVAGQALPAYTSSDHDPLFRFHRWRSNLRVRDVTEVKSIPYTPVSHPYVERLIGTIRREFLDHVCFWNAVDLERKLSTFAHYYNASRVHRGLDGHTPAVKAGAAPSPPAEKRRLSVRNWPCSDNNMAITDRIV